MRYILKMKNSENPSELELRDTTLSHIAVSVKATEIWQSDRWGTKQTNSHNDTIWLYMSSTLGISMTIPGNFWGKQWDALRRPWFLRAVATLERRPAEAFAIISTPYTDAGGAGIVATLSSVVWNKDTKPLDLERKHQIFGVVGYDFSVSSSDVLHDMSVGVCSHLNIFCTLIDTFGSLVFYQDFAAATKEGYLDGQSIHDMFLGIKEPDLADALIEQDLLVLQPRQTSPDSKTLTSTYRLNEKKIQDLGGVATGTLRTEQLKCLELPSVDAPPIQWFVSFVQRSNTAILVVKGYARKNKSGTCNFKTAASPPIKVRRQKCPALAKVLRAPRSNKRLHQTCLRCQNGNYGTGLNAAFLVQDMASIAIINKGDDNTKMAKCRKCPSGFVTKNIGQRACSPCEAGKTASPDATVCVACPHGKTAKLQSTEPCAPCPQGWYATPKLGVTALALLKESSHCTCKLKVISCFVPIIIFVNKIHSVTHSVRGVMMA